MEGQTNADLLAKATDVQNKTDAAYVNILGTINSTVEVSACACLVRWDLGPDSVGSLGGGWACCMD
jgi:hypothetical protein